MVWKPERLKKRAEFVRVSNGVSWSQPAFVLQRSNVVDDENRPPRFGFTATKKIGNAAVRARIKRRLREAARHLDPLRLQAGHDYVLIGRNNTLTIDFTDLCRDIHKAAGKLAEGKGRSGGYSPKPKSRGKSTVERVNKDGDQKR